MKEFFVGQFRVDMGRSQIVDREAIVSMEPRVLQVLLILAEKQGEVVSHQQLLDSVWQDVSVAPNTLQRCIAQLRKALGDSAKLQQVIKTHPKVGYSLLVDVNFPKASAAPELVQSHQPESIEPKIETTSNTTSHSRLNIYAVYAIFAIMVFLACNYLWERHNQHSSSLPIAKLTALTSTDKKEYSPTFSPDGRYIAFQRYVGLCENELWAKDLQNNKEYLLTKTSGIYGTPSWSPNGQQLVFSNVTHCSLASEFQGCKDIRTLNFALAKSEPQEPRIAMACDKTDFSAAVWITDYQIAFFEKSAGHQQRVLRLELSNQTVDKLYSSERMLFDSLSYSPVEKRLAVTQHNSKLQASLALIEPDLKMIEQVELKPPAGYRSIVNWHTNWHPNKAKLITAKGNSFFEIDLTGEFTQHSVPTMQSIADPIYHPDGNSLIASMGIFDKDVELLSWGENLDLQPGYQNQVLHRSILSEREAKFAPKRQQIAFISERSGSQQIWLSELDSEASQLTHLQGNPQIYSFVWSFDGHLIIALVDGQLKLINLDGQITDATTDFQVLDIYQAPSENQVLLEIIENDQEKIIALDIETMRRKDYFQGDVYWAQLSSSGEIYISTPKRQVFLWKNEQVINLVGIENLNLAAKFIYKDNNLVITAKDNSIFKYDLNESALIRMFKINQVLKHVDDVDFKNRQLLVTTVASSRKEIVLFHQ